MKNSEVIKSYKGKSVDTHVNSCLYPCVHQFVQLTFLLSHHCMSRYISPQGILHYTLSLPYVIS